MKNKQSFIDEMQKRHEEGFKKHKGEILTHDEDYIIKEALEEIADCANYLRYLALVNINLKDKIIGVIETLECVFNDVRDLND